MIKRIALFISMLVASIALGQIPITQLPPATLPLTGAEQVPLVQSGHTRQTSVISIQATSAPNTNPFVLQSAGVGVPNARILAGTPNQVILTDGGGGGALTLSLPQSIGTGNSPTFAGLTLTGLNGILLANSGLALTVYAGTSCTNQFLTAISSVGVGTCTTANLTSAQFANQGTTTTVLHGNAAGNPSFAAVTLTTDVTGTLPAPNGGTGQNTYAIGDLLSANTTSSLSRVADVAAGSFLRSGGTSTLPAWSVITIPNATALGDVWYGSATSTMTALAGNITTTKKFLTQTGSGAVSAAPGWNTIAAGDLPGSFSGFANPSATIGLSAVNGVATTAMTSDSAPPLSQAIAPTWTGLHTFTPSSAGAIVVNGSNTANTAITVAASGSATVQGILLTSSSASTVNLFGTQSDLGVFNVRNGANTNVVQVGTVKGWANSGADVTDGAFGCVATCNLYANNTINPALQLLGNTAPTVKGWGPAASALVDMTPDSGTFSATVTGCTANPAPSLIWRKSGNFVNVNVPAFTCTSNATTFTISNAPAVIQPAVGQNTTVLNCQDNTIQRFCLLGLQAGGATWTFNAVTTGGAGQGISASTWTNAGTKGMSASTFTYILN